MKHFFRWANRGSKKLTFPREITQLNTSVRSSSMKLTHLCGSQGFPNPLVSWNHACSHHTKPEESSLPFTVLWAPLGVIFSCYPPTPDSSRSTILITAYLLRRNPYLTFLFFSNWQQFLRKGENFSPYFWLLILSFLLAPPARRKSNLPDGRNWLNLISSGPCFFGGREGAGAGLLDWKSNPSLPLSQLDQWLISFALPISTK